MRPAKSFFWRLSLVSQRESHIIISVLIASFSQPNARFQDFPLQFMAPQNSGINLHCRPVRGINLFTYFLIRKPIACTLLIPFLLFIPLICFETLHTVFFKLIVLSQAENNLYQSGKKTTSLSTDNLRWNS